MQQADGSAFCGANPAFDAFGDLARRGASPLQQSGRRAVQAEAERLIVADILAKLTPAPTSRLLEIGCGSGNLLIPLAFHAASAVGLDHPAVIERAQARFVDPSVTWIGGAFPETPIDGAFDRILIYSVLHYLPDIAAVEAFVLAAAQKLAPGGRLLLGDLPNVDGKSRFTASPAGIAFQAAWQAADASASNAAQPELQLHGDAPMIGAFRDADILALVAALRRTGFHAYLLPQPPDLPFGRTREDILVVRP